MRALVTGASGFVGQHIVTELGRQKVDVVGLSISNGTDVRNANLLAQRVGEARPDAVLHLAGVSSVRAAWADPRRALDVNVLGTLAVLESVHLGAPGAAVITAGSAEEYGGGAAHRQDHLLRETDHCSPINPYGTSKLAAGLLAAQIGRAWGLRCVHVRSFNQIGPGQRAEFVVSNFCRQIACMEAGRQEAVLQVGDLHVVRDFLDVRDAARAYVTLALDQGASGVFNVCSGMPRQLQDVVEMLCGMSAVPLEVRMDPNRVRPIDVPVLVGSPERLREATGWCPTIPLERTLADALDAWRAAVARDPRA